jgi:hypothetical protein
MWVPWNWSSEGLPLRGYIGSSRQERVAWRYPWRGSPDVGLMEGFPWKGSPTGCSLESPVECSLRILTVVPWRGFSEVEPLCGVPWRCFFGGVLWMASAGGCHLECPIQGATEKVHLGGPCRVSAGVSQVCWIPPLDCFPRSGCSGGGSFDRVP